MQSFSAGSRRHILTRRAGAVADLSMSTVTTGDLDVDQAIVAGVYRVNCLHQVGIATATEVGLNPSRYPVRIVLMADPTKAKAPAAETVCAYWKILDVDNSPVLFSRKPLDTDVAVKNLYALFDGLDEVLWSVYRAVMSQGRTIEGGLKRSRDSEIDKLSDSLYSIISLQAATDEQKRNARSIFDELMRTCTLTGRIPYLKIADNRFLVVEPHGAVHTQQGNTTGSRAALFETLACIKVNYNALKARYPTVSDGLTTLCAYSIGAMFRHGLNESYEHQEYYTAYVTPSAANDKILTVHSVAAPRGCTAPAEIAPGSVIDISDLRVDTKVVELANLMVMGSGLMHYLFNHTTGGTVVSGILLTILSMYGLVNSSMVDEMQVKITSMLYEALHPTNKRAIANLMFKNAHVTTHGRCATAPRYEQFTLDAFTQIRVNPYPAGSHKAFICLQGLKRVLQAGLAPFLPWAEQLDSCIETCKNVLTIGARAHIGAAYYTGDHPITQSATIDNYLPEIAHYVHTFNKGDSLCMSPHMSPEVARRSGMNWLSLINDLKGKDVSATSVDIVKGFLATTGAVHFGFDPDDQTTWAKAVQDTKLATAKVDSIFT